MQWGHNAISSLLLLIQSRRIFLKNISGTRSDGNVMHIKIAITFLLAIALTGIFLVPAAGCNTPADPSTSSVTPPSSAPALPLLDTEVHSSVETAYFALG
jgi:hypothetical protein